MTDLAYTRDEIKQKIRKLKKLEVRIRFGASGFSQQGLSERALRAGLVWDEFFDLGGSSQGRAKYALSAMTAMGKEELKEAISEFFFHVYYRFYKENGIVCAELFSPGLLAQFGLPYDADRNAIKKRFRELAKKYHPDTGGDSAKFIELMESYQKLVE